ncbi:hypothetical protein BH20VER3_BH20VER3_03190 [soil metagenome]
MSRQVRLVVTEGALEIPVSLRLLSSLGIETENLHMIDKGGRKAFWRDINKYNQAAARIGLIVGLGDLENEPCFSAVVSKHLKHKKQPAFLLRLAVRMLESWLLADARGLARYLGVSPSSFPARPDEEAHPKNLLVNIARKSSRRQIIADLVPEPDSRGIVGKGYTPRLSDFVERIWDPRLASDRSDSLKRAMAALRAALT